MKGGVIKPDEVDKDAYLVQYGGNFSDFVCDAFEQGDIFNQLHFRQQYKWISKRDGTLLADHVCKFEDYQASFDKVCDKMSIQRMKVPHTNKSEHRPFLEYYKSKKEMEIVANAYSEDMALGNYAIPADTV